MKRNILASLLLTLAALFAIDASSAPSPEKIALVIGVSSYDDLPALPNAVRDAQTVAAALSASGFQVDLQTDVRSDALLAALSRHEKALAALPPTGISIVYFAGHGFNANGVSLIAAADAASSGARAWSTGVVKLARLTSLADRSASGATSLIVIDACRKLIELAGLMPQIQGFSHEDLSPNTAVFYSTGPYRSASDGAPGELSPFANAFVEEMKARSEPWPMFTANVTRRVREATVPEQIPEIRALSQFIGALNDQPVDIGEALYYKATLQQRTTRWDQWYPLVETAANKYNNVHSMLAIGNAYLAASATEGAPASYTETAETWYLKAARTGSGEAWHRLGEIKMRQHDVRGGIDLFKRGATLGCTECNYHLGQIYAEATSPYRDIRQAIYYYSANLTAANCCSAVNLANIYYTGANGRPDLHKAETLYRLAADRGNFRGWVGLGFIYHARGQFAEAVKALHYGELENDSSALNLLGDIYANAEGYIDLPKAIGYFQAAEAAAIKEGRDQAKIDLYHANIVAVLSRQQAH